jgi:predicted enzyme related to lactoylglutathione lyase
MTPVVRFDWHELQTRDCLRAMRFYEAMFGWTTEDVTTGSPRERHLCCREGDAIGAVTISQAPAHVPAFWLPFLSVADLDGVVARARTLGARVLREPAAVPGAGRLAVLVDPRGAICGLRDGAATPAAAPSGSGAFCWDELLTDDAEASAAFYAALTGGSIESIDMGPLGVYRILVSDGRRIAGVMKHPESVHPHWLPYIAVSDVDADTPRAVGLGASLYFPPRDIPGTGRISGIDDPTGAGVCLFRGSL